MGTYANRTCHCCGIRKPQPQMISKEIYVETGKSKTGVSGATFVGTMMGDKKSAKNVNSWLFNSGQRTYKRKRKVWVCDGCKNKVNSGEEVSVSGILVLLMVIGIIFIVLNQ